MSGRGSSRKALLVSNDNRVEVFRSISALHRHLGKGSNWLNSRPGFKDGLVRLDDGSTIHILARRYAEHDWSDSAEEILAVSKAVAKGISETTGDRLDDVLDELVSLLLKRLSRADLRRFKSEQHCIHTMAVYARKDFFRNRRRPDPLRMRVNDDQLEARAIENQPAPSDGIEDLVGLLLPEHLQELAMLKASGHSNTAIRRMLHLSKTELEGKLDEISRILRG